MSARRVAWTIAVLAFTLVAAAGSVWAFEALSGSPERPFYWEDAAAGVVLPVIGAVVLHHRPRNPIGWVTLAMGLAGAVAIAGEQYAYHAVIAAPGSLPAAATVGWVTTWAWFPTDGLVPLVLLLFPDGPPDGWWRRLVPATIAVCAGVVVSIGVRTARDPLHFALVADADPLADPGISGIAMSVGMLLSLVLVALGIASLLLRWRHADALRRAQLRWLVTSVVVGSTLAVAAAFGPVRRRVQSGVDRRFNRARYDAAREVARFGTRLRDEVDLDTLATDLRTVSQRTLSPAFADVWLSSRAR